MEKKGLRKRDKEGRRFCRPMEAETNEINTKQKRGKVTSKLKQGHHETSKCAWVSLFMVIEWYGNAKVTIEGKNSWS